MKERADCAAVSRQCSYLPFHANLNACGFALALSWRCCSEPHQSRCCIEFGNLFRVFRWYGQLRDIEERATEEESTLSDLLDELNWLETRHGNFVSPCLARRVPGRPGANHIELVRKNWFDNNPPANRRYAEKPRPCSRNRVLQGAK
jgi:hypothetical protein